MGFFFDDGNKSEPSDTFGAALKGIRDGVNLGMQIGRGFMLMSLAAQNLLKGRQEPDAQKQLEERWRNQQKRR